MLETGYVAFVHEDEVSKWLDFMRGEFFVAEGAKPVLPYYDVAIAMRRFAVWLAVSMKSPPPHRLSALWPETVPCIAAHRAIMAAVSSKQPLRPQG